MEKVQSFIVEIIETDRIMIPFPNVFSYDLPNLLVFSPWMSFPQTHTTSIITQTIARIKHEKVKHLLVSLLYPSNLAIIILTSFLSLPSLHVNSPNFLESSYA
jgi:hypothetical protein